jgi:hypothetical protein
VETSVSLLSDMPPLPISLLCFFSFALTSTCLLNDLIVLSPSGMQAT